MIKLSKTEAKEKIEDFFKEIKNKEPEEVRKIKKLAMHYHIRLAEKRKLFCQKCFSSKLGVKKIKGNVKTLECKNCGKLRRWRI